MKDNLFQKIENHSAVIGILGLGYVGLPLALAFSESGFKVVGFEIDEKKVKEIKNGNSYLKHIGSERVAKAVKTNHMTATTDFSVSASADVLIICVPTPLDKHHAPDMSYVRQTIDKILPYVSKGKLLSLESTVYPGATEEELTARLQELSFKVGEDIYVVFSPEREDPGNEKFHTRNIPKVVGGSTPRCMELGVVLYQQIVSKVIPVSSTRAAEMTKLLENIYRAVNIGLVNELKMVADQMGINIWEVIDAAATKPFGYTPFYPGPGLGGHCIPIDPFYLTWKAKEYGIHTRFIELAGQVNWAMPEWVVDKVTGALNNLGKSVKDARILVLGVAYKKNIDDMRESPSLELMKLLRRKGAQVKFSDPIIPVLYDEVGLEKPLESVDLNPKTIAEMDCVLVATDHDSFDYEMIQENAKLIVDTRGRYRKPLTNVTKA